MIRHSFLCAMSVWLASIMINAAPCAGAEDLLDRLIDAGQPSPVTMQGPFAGFIATPQVIGASPVTAFVIAPGGQWFIAYEVASGIRVMDMRTGALLRVLRTDGVTLTGLSISRDGATIEATDEKNEQLGWNAATGEKLSTTALDDQRYRSEYSSPQKIDHLLVGTIVQQDEQDSARDPITEFFKDHGLSEQFPDPRSIERIIKSPDGRYAVILGKADQETDEKGNTYDLVKIYSLRHSSTPLVVKIPFAEWRGVSISAFAFDSRHLVLGRDVGHDGCVDPGHVDSAGFEAEDGKLKPLWRNDSEGPNSSASGVSADARFYSKSNTPNGQAKVWDLNQARLSADFNPTSNLPIISSDGNAFAAVVDPDGKLESPVIQVVRHGKRLRLIAARFTNASPYRDLALSPNGRYLAARIDEADPIDRQRTRQYIAVWDTDDGRQIERFLTPDQTYREWKIAAVSNEGRFLLLSGKSVYNSGKWVEAGKSEQSAIVPFTNAFNPVCGVIFCDHVVRDLGVVERLAPKDDVQIDNAVQVANFQGDLSKQSLDGRFIIGSFNDDGTKFWPPKRSLVVDIATGRTLLAIPFSSEGASGFTSDSHNVIASNSGDASITLRDIASGKQIWTLQGTPDLGFVMVFANGHVRVSPGEEKYVKLVKEFEVKPYDEAARRLFEQPVSRAAP
jgi:WD40 repeat protein